MEFASLVMAFNFLVLFLQTFSKHLSNPNLFLAVIPKIFLAEGLIIIIFAIWMPAWSSVLKNR